tara:strand:+ start:87 stop:1079 length:993 start_codon:yes stop_codon:yes gene_type:complete
MIIKNYETNKINLNKFNHILLYGKNEGFKNQVIENLLKNKTQSLNYEEREILENPDQFLESLQSKSLFEDEKIVLIKRATDKIFKIFEEIFDKNLQNTIIIINADILEKKSKLRSFFEKNKKCICVAFYPDNNETLSKFCLNYFKKINISISQSNVNLIVNKCNGDRKMMLNELIKLELFTKDGKKLNSDNISKLINLSEDFSVTELIDNCLIKNEKKIINILNENNFKNEDCVFITRVFLNKAKKILQLSKEFQKNNNIELTISSAKPAIFWKDKEITKQQIYKWKPENINKLIYKLNEIELVLKRNLTNAVNITTDFLLEQSSSKTNN